MKKLWIPPKVPPIFEDGAYKNDVDTIVAEIRNEDCIGGVKEVFGWFVAALVDNTRRLNQGIEDIIQGKGPESYDKARIDIARMVTMPTEAYGFEVTEFTPVLSEDKTKLSSIVVKCEILGALRVQLSSSPVSYSAH